MTLDAFVITFVVAVAIAAFAYWLGMDHGRAQARLAEVARRTERERELAEQALATLPGGEMPRGPDAAHEESQPHDSIDRAVSRHHLTLALLRVAVANIALRDQFDAEAVRAAVVLYRKTEARVPYLGDPKRAGLRAVVDAALKVPFDRSAVELAAEAYHAMVAPDASAAPAAVSTPLASGEESST